MNELESAFLSSDDVIMVSAEAFDSRDPFDILDSNISVINDLFKEHLTPEEISRSAIMSYYVDFYVAQVNNGGFLQFGINSNWSAEIVDIVRQGLRDMGAVRHLALFDEGVDAVGKFGTKACSSAYSGRNKPVKDHFWTIDSRFYALNEVEDLFLINAAWLRRQPNLRVLSVDELQQEVRRRSVALSNHSERVKSALDAEPSYMKLIRVLCQKSRQIFEQVTVGERTIFYDGTTARELAPEELHRRDNAELQMSWFFITNKGLHFMIETEGKATMFQFETMRKIAEIDISKEE